MLRLFFSVLLLCLSSVVAHADGSIQASFTVREPDGVRPAAVQNLTVILATVDSLTLTWTAPGDDGDQGRATRYEVRYALSSITNEAEWDGATLVSHPPVPQVAGSEEIFVVAGLESSTTYYFVLKAVDEGGNWSVLSNCAQGTTLHDFGADSTIVYLPIVISQAGFDKAAPPSWAKTELDPGTQSIDSTSALPDPLPLTSKDAASVSTPAHDPSLKTSATSHPLEPLLVLWRKLVGSLASAAKVPR